MSFFLIYKIKLILWRNCRLSFHKGIKTWFNFLSFKVPVGRMRMEIISSGSNRVVARWNFLVGLARDAYPIWMKFSDLRKAESRRKNFQLVCSVQIGFAVLRIFFVCLFGLDWVINLLQMEYSTSCQWKLFCRVRIKVCSDEGFFSGGEGEGQF